ncbi:MAG: hypothetical protein GY797_19475 [Deltaproteobacteria bacterium]|nr:hypothetical protein [Deltaproteobacteria bacterium]
MLECVFSNEKEFDKLWEEALLKINKPSLFYTSLWMKYSIVYARNSLLKDLSFVILDGDSPVAVCPLFLEQINGQKQFSFAGGYLRAPLIDKSVGDKREKKVEKYTFDIIANLAKEYNAQKHLCLIDSHNTFDDEERYNYLTRYGYIDSSVATQLIDTRKELTELWKEVRKGCKWSINQGRKNYDVDIFYSHSSCFAVHEEYRKMHHRAAGRVTRPIETFNIQHEQVKSDKGILIGVKFNGEYKAFAHFLHNNKGAYYGSYAEDPDIQGVVPLGHLIIWKAIEYYKLREFNVLEIGLQQFGFQIFDNPSEKEIDIAKFKRGFGGKTYPLFRGIRFYDIQQLISEIDSLKKRICAP